MKTLVVADSGAVGTIQNAIAYVVARRSKVSDTTEFWTFDTNGWSKGFLLRCLTGHKTEADRVLQALPAGGTEKFSYEVIPIRFSPALQ